MLLFEGEGEFFPFGEEGGALGAEGFEFGGVALGLFGGGEVAEAVFGGGDGGFEAGDLCFGVAEAVFELLELDGVEALDGSCGFGGERRSADDAHTSESMYGAPALAWRFRLTGSCERRAEG